MMIFKGNGCGRDACDGCDEDIDDVDGLGGRRTKAFEPV